MVKLYSREYKDLSLNELKTLQMKYESILEDIYYWIEMKGG